MLDFLKNELLKFGIELVGAVPLSNEQIIKPYKLVKRGFSEPFELTAAVFAIPYYTDAAHRNISAYAAPRDYHLFCKELFDSIIPKLEQKFPSFKFAGFADDSPINERDAAACAGLGKIGDNMMLITDKYSSFIFLAEIITDCPIPEAVLHNAEGCEHCGLCRKACPISDIGQCLSALTQKKGTLTGDEAKAILKYDCAWGCDICQNVCPHTKKALESGTIFSKIDFFNQALTPYLTSSLVLSMSDDEFASRAYSWRRRETILRNLAILEKNKKYDKE